MPSSSHASINLKLVITPQSGIAPLEVEILCVTASGTSMPASYEIDFGDGSDLEFVESNAYTYKFYHTYNAGFFKPVCKVVKAEMGLNTVSDPGSLIVANWQFETGGDIDTSPAIGPDGTVYVGSEDGNLYAVDPETGDEIWRFGTGGAILSSPAVDADGTIYFSSEEFFYAVKPNGILKWSYNLGDYIFSSPAINSDGRLICVGATNGILYAFNSTGTLKWQFETGDKIVSSPAIGHDGIEQVVYVGSLDRHVYALAANNGDKKWEFETNAEIYASPAIGLDGRIYVGECEIGSAETYDFKFFCLNVDGSKYWEVEGGRGFYSSPAIGPEGIIYVGSWDGYLHALNPGGTRAWSVRTSPPSDINSSPAVSGDEVVYVGCKDGNFYAFQSPETDKYDRRDWVFQTGDIIRSSPVIDAGGTIYFGSRNNSLYAVNPGGSAPAESAWPMFRQNAAHTGTLDQITIPAVISSIPGKNSTGADIWTKTLQVNFSPMMKTAMINIDSFKLEKEADAGRENVEGYAVFNYKRYNDSGYHIVAAFNRLNQKEPLEYDTTYYGTIQYASNQEDAAAENDATESDSPTVSYDRSYSWSFTTEPEPETEDSSGSGGDFGCFIRALSR